MTKWVEVGVAALCWGVWMLFRTTRKRKAANLKPSLSYADVLLWCCMGLDFGLVTRYGWQAFHRPLLYLTLLAFTATVATAAVGPIPKKSLDN